MASGGSIPFFSDMNVADSVGSLLLTRGHRLTRLRNVMLGNTVDAVVAEACREAGLVLVTHNYRDFRKVSKDILLTKGQFDRLDRIELGCREAAATTRMEQELQIIEAEYWRAQLEGRPMRIFVGPTILRLHR